MPAMIQVESLTKYYGSYVGIEDVAFSIDQGEVVGFLGPNGAGKTTTMRILTCSMPATRGTATVAGFDVLRNSLDVRRNVGYLPESPPLYPEMTVADYLRFVADIKGVPGRNRQTRLDYALEVCGLEHMRERIAGQLSKGYRQRVGIAQALIHDPPVLIFDEPTSGLDPNQIIEIRELIRGLGKAHTVILSTHILPEASQTCRRLLVINDGRIAGNVVLDARGEVLSVQREDGETVEYGAARTIRVVVRGTPDGVQEKLAVLPGVRSLLGDVGEDENQSWTLITPLESDARSIVASTVLNAGADLLELRELRPSLEQVFLDLTTRRPINSAEAIEEEGGNGEEHLGHPSA